MMSMGYRLIAGCEVQVNVKSGLKMDMLSFVISTTGEICALKISNIPPDEGMTGCDSFCVPM